MDHRDIQFQVGDVLISEQASTVLLLVEECPYGYKYKVSLTRKQHGPAELHYGFQELRLLTQPPYNYKYFPVVK
jgi:hypothetical protein